MSIGKFPRLNGPLLELSFYDPNWNQFKTFSHFIRYLLKNKASFGGWVAITKRGGKKGFQSKWDLEPLEIKVIQEKLESLLIDPKVLVCDVILENYLGLPGSKVESVSFSYISKKALKKGDTNPIRLATYASVLSELKPGQTKWRNKVFKTFVRINEHLKPAYGSITVEHGLECLTDLSAGSGSYAFETFFLRKNFLRKSGFNQILKLFKNVGYFKPSKNGYYFSCSKAFKSPPKKISGNLAAEISSKVAKILGAEAKRIFCGKERG